MKKGFLDGYKTYNPTDGHGDAAQWQKLFAEKITQAWVIPEGVSTLTVK